MVRLRSLLSDSLLCRVEHVGPLVELSALFDTPDWDDLWTAA